MWSFHQRNPWYRSLMKIHQHGAGIFSKMCTFEVSIGLYPHCDHLIKRIPVIEVSWKSINMELRYLTKCALLTVSIGLFHSFWLSHQKNPCYRSLMKIYNIKHEVIPVIEVSWKSVNIELWYLTNCALLKLA